MIGNKTVLSIIPARGGSKGLPGKNIKMFMGKPLIGWTIESARRSSYIDRVLVSTDSFEIGEIAKTYGAEIPFMRPKELSNDQASGNSVISHALDWVEQNEHIIYDYFVLLQPTSPLRETWQIDEAIIKLNANKSANSLVSIKEVSEHPYWMKKLNDKGYLEDFIDKKESVSRRQDLPQVFIVNGALYLSKPKYFQKYQNFYLFDCLPYLMDQTTSVDIDDLNDFEYAETMMKLRYQNKNQQ